jgi:hypothetical protein
MSAGQYLLGVFLMSVLAGSLWLTGSLVRQMFLPSWSHAPARLAEAVIGVTSLVVASELLGTVGLFSRYPLLLACVSLAGAAFVCRHRQVGHVQQVFAGDEPTHRTPGKAPTLIAIGVVMWALVPWMVNVTDALHTGMSDYDTNSYHMPLAANFAQRASVTGLPYVDSSQTSFFPMNSELIHGVGIVVFHQDVLSPVLNIGWLGLALLAGWCIGRRTGVGPVTMAATALVLAVPIMVHSEAGTAKNDVAALALLLASIALLVNGGGRRPALILAALSAGLAVGTRLNLWASVIALAVVVIAAAAKGRRIRVGRLWAVGVIVGGGFWYARNLLATGNPFPWFGLKLAGFDLPSAPRDPGCASASVAHYLTNPGLISAHLVRSLAYGFGSWWWVVVSLAAVGGGTGLLRKGPAVARTIALVALVSWLAFTITPDTAHGPNASCFGFNTRYAVPALALALIVLPLVFSQRRQALFVVVAIAVAVVLNEPFSFDPVALLVSLALVAVVAAWALRIDRAFPRPVNATAIALVGLLIVAAGWREQRAYLSNRARNSALYEPVEPIAGVLARMTKARVAVQGFDEIFPFYGRDLSNWVNVPAARVSSVRWIEYDSCRSWLLALQSGRYQYVVTARQGEHDPPAAAWTRRYPGARELLVNPPGETHQGAPWRWELFSLAPGARVDPKSACVGFPP